MSKVSQKAHLDKCGSDLSGTREYPSALTIVVSKRAE
jgi:hypothetical protein